MPSLEESVVDHVLHLRPQALGRQVIEVTKLFILDTIGVALAGARAPVAASLRRYLAADPGATARMASLWGDARRVPAEKAALINGTLAHALAFDDVHEPGNVHAHAVVVPAALAAAEYAGATSGCELVAAVAVGVDLTCRLGSAARFGMPIGWWPTSVLGIFGAVAAVARILHLGPAETHDAMGICSSMAAGHRQALLDGGVAQSVQCGLAASGAVTAALLAHAGVTGARRFLTGPFGLIALQAAGSFDRDLVVDSLGRRFLNLDILIKNYPCCGDAQAPLRALLSLMDKNRLDWRDLRGIRVSVPARLAEQIGEPLDRAPESIQEAQVNLRFVLTKAVACGRFTLQELLAAEAPSGALADLAGRLSIVAARSAAPNDSLPVAVEVTTKGGLRFRKSIRRLPSLAREPRRHDIVGAKFFACCARATGTGPSAAADFIALTQQLEKLEMLAPWIAALAALTRASR